jgi:hypothetical protein
MKGNGKENDRAGLESFGGGEAIMSTDEQKQEIVWTHPGTGPMAFLDGWFLSADYKGERVLIYYEKFFRLKRMQKRGHQIKITIPAPLPGLGSLTTLVLLGAEAVDECGSRFDRGLRIVPGVKYPPGELSNVRLHLTQATEAPGVRVLARKERGTDPEAQAWHCEAQRLKEEETLSPKQIVLRLGEQGIHVSEDTVKSAIKRNRKKKHPGAN